MGNQHSAGEHDGSATGWRTIPKRWRAVLKPWRVHFMQMDSILTPFIPHGVSDCVHVDMGVDSTRRGWRENVLRCRETLELLAIIAVVEHTSDGITSTPQEPCDSSAGVSVLACHGTSRRYLINCYNRKPIARVTDVEVFKAFFFAFEDESSLRDEFRHALNEIYSQLTLEMQLTVEKHRRIPVRFSMSNTRFGPDLSVAYLTSAMELVKGIGERTKQANTLAAAATPAAITMNGQWRYRFPFTDTIARLHISPCVLEYGAAPTLTELIALGVEINEEISLGSCSVLGRLPMSQLGPVLQAMTDVSSLRASEGYEQIMRRGEWKQLSLDLWGPDGAWHARQIQAVCSSVAVCKDFKELHLSRFGVKSSRKSRRKILQWLAYALFSKDSFTNIKGLAITNANFQDEDIAAIMAVLLADNPAKELLDGDSFLGKDEEAGDENQERLAGTTNGSGSTDENGSNDSADPGFACLKAGTTIMTKPVDDEEQLGSDPEPLVLKQGGRFRVMRDDNTSGFVDIIVPHYGYCVVPQASVDHFVPIASDRPASSVGYSGSITSLTLEDSNHQALLPLIDFIGPKLVSLEIRIQHSEILSTSDFLRHLVTACPTLEDIKLGETETTSVSVFMDAYESGKCKIGSLSLYDLKAEHSESIVALARMLQDLDSAVAKTLRYLILCTRSHELFDESVFKALAEMLQVNSTIEYLEIDMGENFKEEHKPALKRTKGQRFVDRPLRAACRYAFLSVLHRHARSLSSSTAPPRKRVRLGAKVHDAGNSTIFDRSVIASIFAFAAKRGTRQIRVNTSYAP